MHKGAESADPPQTLEPAPVSTGEGSQIMQVATRSSSLLRAKLSYRTIDILTIVMLGVTIGVAFWGWDQLYNAIHTLSVFTFPPSTGLLGGAWLLAGVIGGLVIRRPGAAVLTEIVASSVEALLGNAWGFSNVVGGSIEGLGAEIVFAIFLWRRFGPAVAILAGAVAGAGESPYEWQIYYSDWELTYRLTHLGLFIISGALVAGLGGWALVRALAATGALDAFGAGRDHRERTSA